MIEYNIYFGTIGKTLGTRYRFTRSYETEKDAKTDAEHSATSFYYKNEGKYGIPSFNQINKEAELTGLDLETLYQDHINDLIRYYVVPMAVDTVSKNKLVYMWQ